MTQPQALPQPAPSRDCVTHAQDLLLPGDHTGALPLLVPSSSCFPIAAIPGEAAGCAACAGVQLSWLLWVTLLAKSCWDSAGLTAGASLHSALSQPEAMDAQCSQLLGLSGHAWEVQPPGLQWNLCSAILLCPMADSQPPSLLPVLYCWVRCIWPKGISMLSPGPGPVRCHTGCSTPSSHGLWVLAPLWFGFHFRG